MRRKFTIQELQHHINIYEKRYKSNQKSYKIRQFLLKQKITGWKNNLRRQISEREQLKEMAKRIKLDQGIELKNSATPGKSNKLIYPFYKTAIERGVKSKNIANFVGVKNSGTINKGRREVVKNPKSKEIYDNMKKILENENN